MTSQLNSMNILRLAAVAPVDQLSMNVAGVPAWLGDTFVSADEGKGICAGFFRLEKGNALVYDYEEMKIVVDVDSFYVNTLRA